MGGLGRFYKFLRASKRYSRKKHHWLEGFGNTILQAAKDFHPEYDESYIDKVVRRYVDEAITIFDYEAVEFPDPLVEMSNPWAVSAALSLRQCEDEEGNLHERYSLEEIEQILAENFGENWGEERERSLFGRR